MATKDSSAVKRLRLREEGRRVRDDFALRLFASGLTHPEIAVELASEFGTSPASVSNTHLMVQRALQRHAVESQDVELARSRALVTLERLLEAWAPLAVGQGLDSQLQPRLPSDKAAEILLKTLDRWTALTGAVRPADNRTQINLSVTVPVDAASKRLRAMEELQREAEKLRTIEGELAAAGTSMDVHSRADQHSTLLPPPTPEE